MKPGRKPKACSSCEHVHKVGTECQRITPAALSSFTPKCGCKVGA
jgi:hypothetical protein